MFERTEHKRPKPIKIQLLRLARVGGAALVTPDINGQLRYMYKNGDFDPHSTVNEKVPHVRTPDTKEFILVRKEVELAQVLGQQAVESTDIPAADSMSTELVLRDQWSPEAITVTQPRAVGKKAIEGCTADNVVHLRPAA